MMMQHAWRNDVGTKYKYIKNKLDLQALYIKYYLSRMSFYSAV